MRQVLPVLLAVLMASFADAATWHVEKDGSGDFIVIQDAIDTAAPGDTIQIGPGIYGEPHIVESGGQDHCVTMYVQTDSLTIIGSGPETVIGPEVIWKG